MVEESSTTAASRACACGVCRGAACAWHAPRADFVRLSLGGLQRSGDHSPQSEQPAKIQLASPENKPVHTKRIHTKGISHKRIHTAIFVRTAKRESRTSCEEEMQRGLSRTSKLCDVLPKSTTLPTLLHLEKSLERSDPNIFLQFQISKRERIFLKLDARNLKIKCRKCRSVVNVEETKYDRRSFAAARLVDHRRQCLLMPQRNRRGSR